MRELKSAIARGKARYSGLHLGKHRIRVPLVASLCNGVTKYMVLGHLFSGIDVRSVRTVDRSFIDRGSMDDGRCIEKNDSLRIVCTHARTYKQPLLVT